MDVTEWIEYLENTSWLTPRTDHWKARDGGREVELIGGREEAKLQDLGDGERW